MKNESEKNENWDDTKLTPSFLLSNKIGGYTLFSQTPISRYEGVFFKIGNELFKTIEEIKLNSPIKSIEYNKWNVIRKREEINETLYMPNSTQTIYYKLNKMSRVDLVLDCRKSYDNRKWGRRYEITHESNCVIIKYSKQNDSQEDNSQFGEYTFYLAIYSPVLEYQKIDQWLARNYSYDNERKSAPSKMHVYFACKLKCADFVMSFSLDKKEAIHEAKEIYQKINEFQKIDEKQIELIKKINTKKEINAEIKNAYENSLYSLVNLTVNEDGTYAGLPWFFQYWARDELISIKGVSKIKSLEFVKKRIMHYLNYLSAKNSGAHASSNLKSADSAGWLFFRINELINSNPELFSEVEKKIILTKILSIFENLDYHDGLVFNKGLETWMDTETQNDNRAGARIEIQTLTLAMLKLHSTLSGHSHPAEKEIIKNVREKMWNGNYLFDGEEDETKRPNIFIAAYTYPQLLSKEEWEKCFEQILPALWLEWGGLSSIDKKNKLFVEEYSGEDNKSYHRGDSWFWINNLCAIVLHRTNSEKYKKYINSILNASSKEINEMGALGQSSELSSASHLSSKGCWAQLWSAAMFVELIDEIYS